ncbi:MAG TPA: CidA/LrgA family protein [Methylobacterium sp.]
MIVSLTLILLAQLLGEGLARGAGLPVPGPLVGMALLLAFLALRDRSARIAMRRLPAPLTDGTLESTGKGLLAHLSLLFVPAAAGIVGRLDVLAAHGPAIVCVVVVSTVLTLIATALTFVAVARRLGPGGR